MSTPFVYHNSSSSVTATILRNLEEEPLDATHLSKLCLNAVILLCSQAVASTAWEHNKVTAFKHNFERCVASIRRSLKNASSTDLVGIQSCEEITIRDITAAKKNTGKRCHNFESASSMLRRIVFEPDNYPNELSLIQEQGETLLSNVMCGYLLPDDLCWPFFYAFKEEGAKGKNLLFNRLGRTHAAIFQECFRVVNVDQGHAVTIGVSVIIRIL